MEEGRLVKWLKNEGDAVKSGDTLAEVETDKAIMELVARGDGVLRKRLINEGDAKPGRHAGRRDRDRRREHRRARRRRGRRAALAALPSAPCSGSRQPARRRACSRRLPAAAGERGTAPEQQRAQRRSARTRGQRQQPGSSSAAAAGVERRPGSLVAARSPHGVARRASISRRSRARAPAAASSSATSKRAQAGAARAVAPIARRPSPGSRRRFPGRPAHADPEDDRQASLRVDRSDPDVLSHRRVRSLARDRDAHGDGRDGRRVQGLGQRHPAEGRRDGARAAPGGQRALARRQDSLPQPRAPRHGRRDQRRPDRAGDLRRRPEAHERDLGRGEGAREEGARAEAQAGGVHGLDVLGLEPRHVRHRSVHGDHQSARSRDPRDRHGEDKVVVGQGRLRGAQASFA